MWVFPRENTGRKWHWQWCPCQSLTLEWQIHPAWPFSGPHRACQSRLRLMCHSNCCVCLSLSCALSKQFSLTCSRVEWPTNCLINGPEWGRTHQMWPSIWVHLPDPSHPVLPVGIPCECLFRLATNYNSWSENSINSARALLCASTLKGTVMSTQSQY